MQIDDEATSGQHTDDDIVVSWFGTFTDRNDSEDEDNQSNWIPNTEIRTYHRSKKL